MSWQQYVDYQLLGSRKVSKAAILGLNGGVWAISEGFQLSSEEQNAVVSAFQNTSQTQAKGLKLNGQKYFAVQVSNSSIYLKKGANGAIIVKTTQTAVVAVYESPIQQAESAPVVEGLGDYLRSNGF
ncbi:Profilin-1B [Penicillium robsamsonii]|uniref:Profilin-1B n=1 Tax=Penicillium robsamsonii TaxID=1792511 RepID=UPI00254989F0|nr:Profilin-1B [Penicillium robsamsonii]KAJ5822628.1 Profilin-1B [Penicillium robsamsonii]